jgi:hypothetical protein
MGLSCLAFAVAAQPPDPSPLSGSVSLGVRSVDVSGTETKFKQDINLDDGARLFDVSMSYRPTEGDSPVDEVSLNASNLGGDPFETIQFTVRRFGAYDLKVDRRRSAYFYEDTILPVALANLDGVTAGDFHRFNFERVRDTASFDIDVSPATRVSLGLERQTRAGNSETTLDIERDEFEFHRPIDESLNALRVGVSHGWDRVTLIADEELRKFENTSELFLPGASPGQNSTDPAELQIFMLGQAYDYESRNHLLRAVAKPSDRLDVSGLWQREDLDLDLQASEQSEGIDFGGTPFVTDTSGSARIKRDLEIAGIDLGYTLNDHVRVTASTRSSGLDQRGGVAFGVDAGAGDWTIETNGFEFGAEFGIRAGLLIAAGWSTESRDTSSRLLSDGNVESARHNTDRDGYFLRMLFTGDSGFEITASIEDNDIDDPFTLASATDSRRYKLKLRRNWNNGFAVTAGYRKTDIANENSGWGADTEQSDIRLSYRQSNFEVSTGYSNIDTTRDIQAIVTGGSRQELFPIFYNADSSFKDVIGRWLVNDRISLGGSLRNYDNHGSFALERDDHSLFAEFPMTSDYSFTVMYRNVNFVEDAFDAYDADILELAVRLNW